MAVCLCLLKTEIKQEKLLLRGVFFIVTVCILSVSLFFFSQGLELKNKNKNHNTISNRNTCRIEILKTIAIHIVSAPKYRDRIESGGRCIVPCLVYIFKTFGYRIYMAYGQK